jgi:hypothetical protein
MDSLMPEELLLIGELFERQGWMVEVDLGSPFPELFERFCRMCSRLTKPQRELAIALAEDYRWLRRDSEEVRLIETWKVLVSSLEDTVDKIAVIPLRKPRSSGRPKSSDSFFYLIESAYAALSLIASPRKVTLCKNMSALSRVVDAKSVIVFVDDYVGSGRTASESLDYAYSKCPSISMSNIVVMVIAAQRAASVKLGGNSCRIVSHLTLDRGISDNPRLDVANAAKRMVEIERLLGIKKEMKFGYAQSEALVTLMRTPNNTFPVFWTNKKVKNRVWDSPFTRFKHG